MQKCEEGEVVRIDRNKLIEKLAMIKFNTYFNFFRVYTKNYTYLTK